MFFARWPGLRRFARKFFRPTPLKPAPAERRPAPRMNVELLETRTLPSVLISGTVINDLNGNGAVNTGEVGLAGATVKIYEDSGNAGVNGSFEASDLLRATLTTASDGNWTGSSLNNNKTYFVIVSPPAGYASTNAIPETIQASGPGGDGTTATKVANDQ